MKPTPAQIEKWERVKKSVKALGLRIQANRYLAENLSTALSFGKRHKIELPALGDPNPFEVLKGLQGEYLRLEKLINGVELEKLGLRFEPDGDISIMGPSSMSEDELKYWRGLEGGDLGWLIVPIGIVVLGTVIAYIIDINERNDELELREKKYLDHLNNRYCEDPNSSTCKLWLKEKDDQDYGKNLTLVDKFKQQAKKMVEVATTGMGWGIAIAIPLLIYMLVSKKK